MLKIFNSDGKLVPADELRLYLVKNGITDVELDSLASIVINIGKYGEMSFNTLNKVITLVQRANDELNDMCDCFVFNVELDFAKNRIEVYEAEKN